MHITAMLSLAVGGHTFKDVDSVVVDMFDMEGPSEEDIDWCSPILCDMICE
jgi:hypothetical protein